MRPMPALLAVAFTALFSALACGASPSPASHAAPSPARDAAPRAPLAAPGDEALYLGDGSVVSVVDGATGKLRRRMPAGAPSPDWTRLYSVAGSYANVQLRMVDTASGAILRALPVPAWVIDARLSSNGRWLALVAKPDPRARVTRFQVRDTELARPPIEVELPGNFAFDGLSGDGQRLYLLELGSRGSYKVKLYDLAAGRLMPRAIADKANSSTVMSGAAVNSLTTADGQEQLTLYERDAQNQAFVHVLPVGAATEFAYCVDLPAPGAYWTLTAGPDGRHFYAANLLSRSVVVLTAGGLEPPRVSNGRLDGARRLGLVREVEAKEGEQRTAAAVSADGATLFVGSGDSVTSVDAARLRAGIAASLSGEQVLSLAAGRSGWLYALTASGRLLRIDPGPMRLAWSSAPDFAGTTILHTGG